MSLAGDSRLVGCQHDTRCQLAVTTITATGVPAKLHARDTDLICAAELGEREGASEFVKRGLGGGSPSRPGPVSTTAGATRGTALVLFNHVAYHR